MRFGILELRNRVCCKTSTVSLHAMVWIFIAVKNRYLNLSAVLKFATTKKWTETSRNDVMQPKNSSSDSRPIFPSMSSIRQVLKIPLLMEEALFTRVFWRWVSLFKYLQELNKGSSYLTKFEYVWATPRHNVIGNS